MRVSLPSPSSQAVQFIPFAMVLLVAIGGAGCGKSAPGPDSAGADSDPTKATNAGAVTDGAGDAGAGDPNAGDAGAGDPNAGDAGAGSPRLCEVEGFEAQGFICPEEFRKEKPPVLLVHGMIVNAAENWSWNWEHELRSLGYDVCTYTPPRRNLADMQNDAKRIVAAVQYMYEVGGHKKVDIVAQSTGSLVARWAIKYWPSIEKKLNHVVLLGAQNHGTELAVSICNSVFQGACPPSAWQIMPGSEFLKTLNTPDETPGDIHYTVIYSDSDEVAIPKNTPLLQGAATFHVQTLCPNRYVGHLTMEVDAVVWNVGLSALESPTSIDPGSFPKSLCNQLLMPGISPFQVVTLTEGANVMTDLANAFALAGFVDHEPPIHACAKP